MIMFFTHFFMSESIHAWKEIFIFEFSPAAFDPHRILNGTALSRQKRLK